VPNIVSVILTGQVSPLTAALAQGAAQLGAFGARANRLGAQAQAAATQANRLGSQAEHAAAKVTRLGAQADAAAAAATRLRREAATGGEEAARLGRQADAAAGRAARLREQAAGAAEEAGRLGAQARRAAAEAERLGAEAERAAQHARRLQLGMQAAAAGGALLAAGLIASIAAAIDFEAKMRAVSSIDKNVRDNFSETSQAVLDMSKHMSQSAGTLAAGLYDVAGSGFYGADAMHILEVSAMGASAGMTDTATSSGAVVAILNAYGMGANQAERASDALFATVNYGVISYEALTGAMAHVVGTAAQAGISIEEVGSALATMTRSGISASEAGVSLNNLIAKLINPSKSLGKVFQQLGINIQQDLANPAIGLHGVMEKLRVASGGNVAVIKQWLPEIRAARGALALWAADGRIYEEVVGQMGTATLAAGSAMDAYGEVSKSAKERLAVLRNQIVSTGIELGTKFLPYVTGAVSELTEFGGKVKSVATEVGQALAPGFRKLVDAGRDVVDMLGDLNLDVLIGLAAKIGIGAVVAGFNALAAAVSATTGFLADHTVIVHTLVAAWLAFNVGAVVAGIRALAVAFGASLVTGMNAALAALGRLLIGFGVLGGGSILRGLLMFSAPIAAIAAGLLVVTNEINRTRRAAEELKAVDLRIDEIFKAIPPATSASFRKAREDLAAMRAEVEAAKAKYEDYVGSIQQRLQFWERTGSEMKKNEEAVRRVTAAQEEATRKEDYFRANLSLLANEFGLTTAAVERMAVAAGLDLSQALGDLGASGGTLHSQFSLLVPQLSGAALNSEEFRRASNALAADMDAAEKTLKLYTDQFERLSGVMINAETSAAEWRIKLLELRDGTALAAGAAGQHTASLDQNTVAGNQNLVMLLGLANSMNDIASDEYRRVYAATNDASAAATAYSGTLGRLQGEFYAAAIAAGFTEGEVRDLISRMGLIPPDVSTDFQTPGLAGAQVNIQRYIGTINSIPRNVYTTLTVTERRQAMSAAGYTGGRGGINQATGGPVRGPGGPTSDDVPIWASAGEWVIRASAVATQGQARMAALNAGRADIVPRYATGGPVGYAAGGAVSPAVRVPVGMSIVNNLTFNTTVTVSGGGADAAATARVVRVEVDKALGRVAERVRAGVGRR
jgi:TP901 family phage tail tape measure protein